MVKQHFDDPVFTGRSKGPGGGLGTQRERSARFAQRLTSHPSSIVAKYSESLTKSAKNA